MFEIKSEPYYRKRWKIYCEANDIPYISPYEMRHTFVSIVKDLPEGQLKKLIGNSQNMDTFGVYAHRIHGDMEHTAGNLQNIFEGLIEVKEK